MGTEKQQAQVDVQIEVELEVPFTILHLISWGPTGGGGKGGTRQNTCSCKFNE